MKNESGQQVEILEAPATEVANADAIPPEAAPSEAALNAEKAAINKEEVALEAEPGPESSADAPAATAEEAAAVPSEAVNTAKQDTRPSILYCVPANVLDITSGAALSQRTLLISLARMGFRAVALEATIFDSAHGGEHVLKAGEVHKDKNILKTVTDGLEHIIIRTKAVRRGEMTCAEQEIYLKGFREQIQHRRPDFIFVWGGMLLEMTMMREAREAGIPVVFYLVNGGYKNKETFKYVSVVVTDTAATARLYKERLGLDCKVVGKFIDPALVKPKVPRRPDFITFINPSFEKGVSLFMPLARLALKECPEVRFLVVQSRGRWGNALGVLKYQPQDFPNVKVIGHQRDMRPVYASTRALLLPSLWHESGARVIAEAQINGIPVIASDTGGSAELIGQGGAIIEVPEAVRDKKTERAPEDVVRPWLEQIKRIWNDATYYEELCRKVEAEALQHDIERNTKRFIAAVSPAVLQSKGKVPAKPETTKQALQLALSKKQRRTQLKQQAKQKSR